MGRAEGQCSDFRRTLFHTHCLKRTPSQCLSRRLRRKAVDKVCRGGGLLQGPCRAKSSRSGIGVHIPGPPANVEGLASPGGKLLCDNDAQLPRCRVASCAFPNKFSFDDVYLLIAGKHAFFHQKAAQHLIIKYSCHYYHFPNVSEYVALGCVHLFIYKPCSN